METGLYLRLRGGLQSDWGHREKMRFKFLWTPKLGEQNPEEIPEQLWQGKQSQYWNGRFGGTRFYRKSFWAEMLFFWVAQKSLAVRWEQANVLQTWRVATLPRIQGRLWKPDSVLNSLYFWTFVWVYIFFFSLHKPQLLKTLKFIFVKDDTYLHDLMPFTTIKLSFRATR